MPSIEEVRQKFPQYGDMSDSQLADAIHRKFYADMPRDQFDAKIGINNAAAEGLKQQALAREAANQDTGLTPEPMNDVLGGLQPATAAPIARAAGRTLANVPKSAGEFAVNTVQPFLHPIETAENIGSLGKGILQKFGVVNGKDSEKYADAVGQFFKDRYGSIDNISKTIEEDPVGALADLSVVLTGGGSAAARVPGAVGEVGRVVSTVGRAVDPLSAVGAVAKGAGRVAAEVVGGVGTHTGAQPIIEAAKAGAQGGEAGSAFRQNLFGNADKAEVVSDALSAMDKIRQERGRAYRSGMIPVAADKAVLDFAKVDSAIKAVEDVKKFKGQDLSPTTKGIRSELKGIVDEWRGLTPAEFHTAEGLDALKQKIGDVLAGTERGTPEFRVASAVYNGVKQTIVDQAPAYAKVMQGYEEASTLLKQIEKTLSLPADQRKLNVDTALRKLQSVLRDNVNTNYGQRAVLADYLRANGAENILSKIAGQALSSPTPRGLGKVVLGGIGAGALLNPHLLGAVPFTSPMAVGLGAHALGAASRLPLRQIGQSSFQIGRQQ